MDLGPVLNSFDKQCIVSDCGLHCYEEIKVYELEWIRVWICVYWREGRFFCYKPFPIGPGPWKGSDVIIKLFHGWCLGTFCGNQIIRSFLSRNILKTSNYSSIIVVVQEQFLSYLVCSLLRWDWEDYASVCGHFFYYDIFLLCNIHIRTCKVLRIVSTCVNTALVVDIIISFYFIFLSVIIIDSSCIPPCSKRIGLVELTALHQMESNHMDDDSTYVLVTIVQRLLLMLLLIYVCLVS